MGRGCAERGRRVTEKTIATPQDGANKDMMRMSKTSILQPLSPYSSATAKSNIETHTLSVLVDNEPGVLARVVGMFSGRGYNIESLTVAEVAHETHLSRITIVTSGTPEIIEQIRHQLERLVPVHSVNDLTLTVRAIERELAMIKVRGKGENQGRGDAARGRVPRQGDRRDDRELHLRTDRRAAQDRRFRRAHAPDRAGRGLAHRRRRDLARAGADLGAGRRRVTAYMWYISSRSSADERARISASVQRSSTLAMALRASTMIRRTEQDLRSPQSSQGRNAVTEAH